MCQLTMAITAENALIVRDLDRDLNKGSRGRRQTYHESFVDSVGICAPYKHDNESTLQVTHHSMKKRSLQFSSFLWNLLLFYSMDFVGLRQFAPLLLLNPLPSIADLGRECKILSLAEYRKPRYAFVCADWGRGVSFRRSSDMTGAGGGAAKHRASHGSGQPATFVSRPVVRVMSAAEWITGGGGTKKFPPFRSALVAFASSIIRSAARAALGRIIFATGTWGRRTLSF